METQVRKDNPDIPEFYLKKITLHYDKTLDHYNTLLENDSWLYEMFLKVENSIMLFVETAEFQMIETKRELESKNEEIQRLKVKLASGGLK